MSFESFHLKVNCILFWGTVLNTLEPASSINTDTCYLKAEHTIESNRSKYTVILSLFVSDTVYIFVNTYFTIFTLNY